MKPKRFYFRSTALFSVPLRCGAPVFIGFAVFISGLTADGAIYGSSSNSKAAKSAAGATPAGGNPPATANVARANAKDLRARTNLAVGSALAMQKAARKAAQQNGINNLGKNPNRPDVNLPDVQNGLGIGGLQVALGVGTDPTKWTGAELPTSSTYQSKIKGSKATITKTKVTIRQTSQQALLNWQTFNVGKNTVVKFDQSKGGADVSKWVAFNKIDDPTGNPTQILGSIKAQGQVYLINGNGIIFGSGSQVNARGLTVSSLPINDNLIKSGLLNNPDSQFLFSGLAIPAGGKGTPAFTPQAPLAINNDRYGDVIIQKGASLKSPTNASKIGGRITLVGPNILNEGSISTPDGQTILAAGLQVGFTSHSNANDTLPGKFDSSSLRGLDVFIGAVESQTAGLYAGRAEHTGVIQSARGNITIAGREVNQFGILDSTTSVALNGRIDLLAHYNAASVNGAAVDGFFRIKDAGVITIGKGSLMRILPEINTKETTNGNELALRSQINVAGKAIHFQENSLILAPNALVNLSVGQWLQPGITDFAGKSKFLQSSGQIYLDKNALIDVSGSVGVEVPVSQNIITVELRGAELAGSPLQRLDSSNLRGKTVSVDIRDAGIYQQEMWLGTPLADLSGFIGLIQKGVGQLTVAGGSVNISSGESVVMQAGSKINVSGGSIKYLEGAVKTTQLISKGRLIDISKALPNESYDGIFNSSSVNSRTKWSFTENYKNPLAPDGSRIEKDSISGAAGGNLAINSPAMALDGELVGQTFNGERQRIIPAAASQLSLNFISSDITIPTTVLEFSPTPPNIIFQQNAVQQAAEPFALGATGDPLALNSERKKTVFLSPQLLVNGGFGVLEINNNDGNISVPAGVDLTGQVGGSISLRASNIDVNGSVTVAGGTISFITSNYSLDTINQAAVGARPPATVGRGIFTLGAAGKLSTAGMLVDDRSGVKSRGTLPLALAGGTIKIEGYSANLTAGGVIDVSGGAAVASNSSLTYGSAGKINISTSRQINFPDAGSRQISFFDLVGGTLKLGATLQGFSGTKAGSLAIKASAIRVGGSSLNPDVTVIAPEFFNQGGFSDFSLQGIGLKTDEDKIFVPGVLITAGTKIEPVVQSYVADISRKGGIRLNLITRAEGLRTPGNLSFTALGAKALGGEAIIIGNMVMEEGASIRLDGTLTTDANISSAGKGSVSFRGETVTLRGSVIVPGGTISVAEGNSAGGFPSLNSLPLPNALTTILLSRTAVLSTAGKVLLVENPFGLRRGQVIAGGSINVSGNLVAESGAILDVSGTLGVLDLLPPSKSLGGKSNGSKTVPVRIASNGGSISFTSQQMLFTDATLLGKAGGKSATGSTLSVSSKRFYPPNSNQVSTDANLVVTQNGPTIPGADSGLDVGKSVLDAAGKIIPAQGYFSVASFAAGGFDTLALKGNVKFDGPVSINVPGSLSVASGGVIYANDKVSLSASHVSLGKEFLKPSLNPERLFDFLDVATNTTNPFFPVPTHGSGSLTVKAKTIDIGTLSLQGIGQANFDARSGDVRGNGTLHIAGDLFFKAGQIYPTTQGAFNLFAYDYKAGGVDVFGSITFKSGKLRPLPLSGGGKLSMYATKITQDGTLRAPIGTINLGWDGTGAVPFDPIAGLNGIPVPITSQLTLEKGSVTSVTAVDPKTGKGIRIPYGVSSDGKTWIDPIGNDITLSGAPAKTIQLSAANVTTEKGSKIDIRGGGDLYAFRWIEGNGGRTDVLATNNSFAVIPKYGFDYAPYAPFNNGENSLIPVGQPGYVNDMLKVGDVVTLGASRGLAAGEYTLLPARYALLPGAFLVTPQSGPPVGTVNRPDGSTLVSGYRSNTLNPARKGPTLISQFEIASRKVVKTRSEYEDLLANQVLRNAAIVQESIAPRLPIDSGYLSFSATGKISIAGGVKSKVPKDSIGRGSLIDINGPGNILINKSGTGGDASDLVLQASILNSLSGESLLIGGLRSFTPSGVTVAVNAVNLTLDNEGEKLKGPDIILVAKSRVTLAKNSAIEATGEKTVLDRITLGDATPGSGDGALVRVSGNRSGGVSRLGVSDSNLPGLFIRDGASLKGGSIFLDSTSQTSLSSKAKLNSSALSISSGQISIQLNNPGALNPTDGIVLSGDVLADLQDSAKQLSLLSYSSLDIYGTGKVGLRSIEQLSLQANAIRGFNTGDGTVTFLAKNFVLGNAAGLVAAPPLTGAPSGSILFDVERMTLGVNALRVDKFANVTIAADNGVVVSGIGRLDTAGNLELISPVVTGQSSANYQITSNGSVRLKRPTAASDAASGGFGAKLIIEGTSVKVDSNIRLASGQLTLHGTSGNVVIGDAARAEIDLAGTATRFNDVIRYTSGGTVDLVSDGGSVDIASLGNLSVAAPAGGGNAGKINVKAPTGAFNLAGTILGSANAAARKGSFSLDAATIAGGNLTPLDTQLNAGQFSEARQYRIRNGDLTIGGTATARDYQAIADNGALTVTGTINASGATGGKIQLQSSGSLVLANGAALTVAGQKFNSAGKGGAITLEAGAHRNGVIDSTALLDLRSGSSLDLGVAENNVSRNSAQYGQFTGKLHLRAPSTAANDDIQLATIGSTITGASSILVEGYKLYTPAGGAITTSFQNTIRNDAQSFLGAAGIASASYTTLLGRLTSTQPGLDLVLAPGAEIINPAGDLTLGTPTSTATSDWDLGAFRFGPRGAPGVLTLRAAGDLVFFNALSDGFARVAPSPLNGNSALWLAPLLAQSPNLPVNTQSWSYRFAAGADLNSADFGSVMPVTGLAAGKGSLLLGKNYGGANFGVGASKVDLTSVAVNGRYQVIRTGSGDIDIHAARNVHLLNQFATIYTAGTQVADPLNLFILGDFVLPVLRNSQATNNQPVPSGSSSGSIGPIQQNYFVQYAVAGGNVSIQAAENIAHLTRDVATGMSGNLITDSSRQLPNQWLYRRGFIDPATGESGVVRSYGSSTSPGTGTREITDPSASTTWWVDYSNFFEGVGALGGGNVTLNAGRDVQNVDAVAPTNARMAAGRPSLSRLIELGGGDVTVLAGRNIDGGVYYVSRGRGRLEAGANITTNATRSPTPGIIASLTSPIVSDPNSWLPTTLFLGNGGFDVQAAGDLLLGPTVNPFLLPQGNGNKFWYKTYFSTYTPDSEVNVISLGGNVTHRTTTSLASGASVSLLQNWVATTNALPLSQTGTASALQPWLRLSETKVDDFKSLFNLAAPTLRSTALSGDIKLAGDITLAPSPHGQLELIAKGSISGFQLIGKNGSTPIYFNSTINVSDADPNLIPSVTTPYAYQQVVGTLSNRQSVTGVNTGAGFLNILDAKFTETGADNGSLEAEQARHTAGGLHQEDREPLRIYALGGDIDGFTLFSPKVSKITAGRDVTDVAFYLQNLKASDSSVLSAGRDITLYNSNSLSRQLAGFPNSAVADDNPRAGDVQVSGPGNVQVLAGRDLDLGIGNQETNGIAAGITSIGNRRNPFLGELGANITAAAGIGPATSLASSKLNLASFIKDFVLTKNGKSYLKKIAPKVDFSKLTKEEQARIALEIFYLVLRDTGRDFNKPKSAGFRNYKAGLKAIKSLFSQGPWKGEILTQSRDIRTRSGGNISIFAPGGGLTLSNSPPVNLLAPPGIITETGGNISIFTDQDVSIGKLRIFTLRGGNAIIWSSKGDIAAGSSSRTVASAPPTRVIYDGQSAAVETDLAGLATGGGIGVLATVAGVAPGDVDLIAPEGTVDAGDAGIRVSGNINIASLKVLNVGSISAGGKSSGVPSAAVSAPNVGVVTSAQTTAAATNSSANSQVNPAQKIEETPQLDDRLSLITVEVIGYGGASEDEEEDEDKEKKEE